MIRSDFKINSFSYPLDSSHTPPIVLSYHLRVIFVRDIGDVIANVDIRVL